VPIDCEAISFLPLADVVGSSIVRGPCLCRRYSTGRSLNSHIPAITCKDRPSNPRQLVCQGHDVAMCSRKQSLNPPAERHIFLGKTRGEPCAAVDQQHPQITVAALADSLGSLVGIGAAPGDDIVHPFGDLNEPPKPRSKTVALVRQYLRQIPLELASLLRHDATLQHERTQLIDERCPLCNQASAHAMQ